MKFKLLNVGQKFEYQGDVFVKVSPIIASNVETGHNKMIPAYATLQLQEHSINEKEVIKKDTVKMECALNAFNDFYKSCITLIDDKKSLEIARDKFMQDLIEKS